MNLWFRLLLMLLRRPWRSPVPGLATTVVRLRVWPLDLDFNRHVTNGRYFTLADVGRMDYVLRSGAFRVALRHRALPIVGEGTSPKTLNNELGYLRAVYNELRGLGQIDYANPLELVKPFRIEERELSWLTSEQITILLGAIRDGCDNPHVEPITLICLATGARWSEAEGLVPARLRNSSVTFSKTKSSKVRSVPIDPALEQLIRAHWKQYGQFTTGSINAFRRALDRSGIELPQGQATHALRHSFASHFMQKGGNILTLQKILGHSSLAMTMRYAHLAPEHLVEAVRLNPLEAVMLKCHPINA